MNWILFIGLLLAMVALGSVGMLFDGRLGERRTLRLIQGCCAAATTLLLPDWQDSSVEDFLGFGPPWLSQAVMFAFLAGLLWGLLYLATAVSWSWIRTLGTKDPEREPREQGFIQELRRVVTATMIVVLIVAYIAALRRL